MLFRSDGFKLDDAREAEIEALLDASEDTLPRPSAEGLGTLVDYPEGLRKYEKFLVATGVDLGGMKVALDAANGAAAVSARNIFLDLNAEIAVIGDQPDGLNINAGVGSTHPEQLQALWSLQDSILFPLPYPNRDRSWSRRSYKSF